MKSSENVPICTSLRNPFRLCLERARGSLYFSFYHKAYKRLPIIPFYHTVSDDYLPHVHHLFRYRRVSEFESDIRLFLKYFKFLSLGEFIECRDSSNGPENGILLTFDDGLRECFDVIHPVLRKYGVPAVFFITTDFLDNKTLFYRHKASLVAERLGSICCKKLLGKIAEKLKLKPTADANEISLKVLQISFNQQKLLDEIAELCEIDFQEFLAQRRPYLDSEQLVELKTHGHDIGAHGVDHQWLNEMNPNRQFEQMCESVQLLTSLLKDHIRAFSFPFNSEGVSPEICERAISGEIVDVIFGAGGIGTWNEPHCHQRFSMEGTASSARQILTKQYRCLMPSKQ